MNKRIIHSVFEHTVEIYPDNIAIREEHRAITYRDLHQAAQRAALQLHHIGVRKHVIVGLLLEPSIDYIVALLGTLKAGGAFLPLDAALPDQRLLSFLTRTPPRVLILEAAMQDRMQRLIEAAGLTATIEVITRDRVMAPHALSPGQIDPGESAGGETLPHPALSPDGNDACYLMFTSGSTGEPKAIEGNHKGLSHFVHWELNEFKLDAAVRVSLLAALNFDVSLRDILVPLVAGGTLYIPDAATKESPRRLLDWIEHSGLTLIHCVPSLFRLLIRELEGRETSQRVLPELQYILLAGEPLFGKDVVAWRRAAGRHVELVNLYGPTETTLAKLFYRIKDIPENPESIMPLGHPIANTAVLILHNGTTLCPIGRVGELYIKTPFRSNGYYRDPERTREQFVVNPLTGEANDILYKTGDLGRYRPDRSVEFLGRLDHQIKVNGIRVELFEIESQVLKIPAIDQAVIVAHPTQAGDQRLACYYTLKKTIEVNEIRDHLSLVLPAVMIPSYFIELNAFPLTMTGKIDRKGLPKPEDLLYEKMGYEAPATPMELALARIWGDILALKKVGVTNSFFEIGGQSLYATKIVSQIYRELGVELQLGDFFEHPTIRQLVDFLNARERKGFIGIKPVEAREYYDLSSAQRRLWILDQLEPGLPTYNIPAAFILKGDLDVAAFKQAFQALIVRHESLRTVFIEREGEPFQKIHPHMEIPVDVRDFPQDEIDNLSGFVEQEAAWPFDLSVGPLVRLTLCRLPNSGQNGNPASYLFMFNMHHIICDGWSMEVLVREFLALYHAFSRGQENPLGDLGIQYRDYAAWQNARLDSGEMELSRTYWRDKLQGPIPVLSLPTDYPPPRIKTYHGKTAGFLLVSELLKGLEELSSNHATSLFVTLLTVVKALLHRYTGETDIVIGTPVAGREHPDLENQIGFYVNTLVLRDTIRGGDRFTAVLESVKTTTSEAYNHASYPFDDLVDRFFSDRNMSRSPFFDVMVVQQDNKPDVRMQDVAVTELEHLTKSSKFDLTLHFSSQDNGLDVAIEYNTDLFKPDRIRRLFSHFEELVKSVLRCPDTAVKELNILGEQEKRLVTTEFNDAAPVVENYGTTLDLFECQVLKTPEAVALECRGRRLTYRELDECSSRLASYLQTVVQVQPETLIGVMLKPGEWMMIGFLGIMKSGCAYVPIDPGMPRKRIENILANSRISLVLSSPETLEKAGELSTISAIDIQDLHHEGLGYVKTASVDTLAYVLYTSGSTGVPKGVPIKHGSMVNYLTWACEHYFASGSYVGHMGVFTSPSFDLTLTSLFLPLLRGKTVHFFQDESIESILEVCFSSESQIDVIKLTPSHIKLLRYIRMAPTNIGLAIVGGEALLPEHIRLLRMRNQAMRICNEYGPTEATVGCTAAFVEDERHITIGTPVANTQIYILDAEMKPQPLGIAGEIYIGGAGLSPGYLNQRDLTERSFVENPLKPGTCIYRTGDMGCFYPNGEIQYLGRVDEMIKIRGYRIEPGEIEQALLQYEAIREAAVVTKRTADGDSELVAYLISPNKLDTEDLRRFLSDYLPDYMMPSYFVPVQSFPLNPTGKLDVRALPEPDADSLVAGRARQPAANAVEQFLLRIWQEILGQREIGVTDNFFALGGNSLKAIRIVSRVNEELGEGLTLRHFFQHPVVRDQAATLQATHGAVTRIEPAGTQDYYDLSPAQKRLWIVDQMENGLAAFNMPGAFILKGELNVDALKAALHALLVRHESLRTTFVTVQGEPKQKIDPQVAFKMTELDFSAEPDPEDHVTLYLKQDAGTPFDLSRGPLLRATLIRLRPEEGVKRYAFIFNIHHIISDGWSMDIFVRDLLTFYHQLAQGGEATLPPLTIQYKDYAAWQNALADSPVFAEHKRYWLHKLEGELPVLDLPLDYPRPDHKTYHGKKYRYTLDEATSAAIREIGLKYGLTHYMVFLSLVKILLFKWRPQEVITVGADVAGRGHSDLEDQIGFYLNLIVLKDRFHQDDQVEEILTSMKQSVLEAYEHSAYPFDTLVEALAADRDFSRSPLFDVLVSEELSEQDHAQEVIAAFSDKVSITPLVFETEDSKYDLTFFIRETGKVFECTTEYNTDLFKEETIRTLADTLEKIPILPLTQENMTLKECVYRLLSEAERFDAESMEQSLVMEISEEF